ncbi:MAG: tetratricopeptide repeat protein [Anaerolineae bacterium]|nr:tetratricopeptide repeat protein [Anaerolineae bacterium]
MIQTSTEKLRGRKLFLWGSGSGGRRWQEFLSVPGQAYLEIQAGLARTQLEHVPMPPRTEWRWLEAYGLMQGDAATIQGSDWSAAVGEVDSRLEALLPAETMQAEFERCGEMIDRQPAELFQRGSGWGALERLRREADGEPPFCTSALIFDDESLGAAQQPWLQLLNHGTFPQAAPDAVPTSYMVQAEWHTRLEQALQVQPDSGWLAWLHLGVMRQYDGDDEGARAAWEESYAQQENPWALRNLALLARLEGDLSQAAALYQQAHQLLPDLLPLTVEVGRALIDAGQAADWLALLDAMSAAHKQHGRLRLLEGEAALAVGDYDRVQRVFDDHVIVADLREGEKSLSQLWFDYQAKRLSEIENIPNDDALRARVQQEYPLPPQYDFRMVIE